MSHVSIKVVLLPHSHGIALPKRLTEGSSGADLCAAINEDIVLAPKHKVLIPTGLCMQIPSGYEAQIRSRSGLAAKYGVSVLNSPGTIDSDYRGEIMVILINLGQQDFTIKRGDRIAQMVISQYFVAEWVPSKTLEGTARGEGGFGSTGTM